MNLTELTASYKHCIAQVICDHTRATSSQSLEQLPLHELHKIVTELTEATKHYSQLNKSFKVYVYQMDRQLNQLHRDKAIPHSDLKQLNDLIAEIAMMKHVL